MSRRVISNRLARKRLDAAVVAARSQIELGRRLGIPQASMSRYCRGALPMSPVLLKHLGLRRDVDGVLVIADQEGAAA